MEVGESDGFCDEEFVDERLMEWDGNGEWVFFIQFCKLYLFLHFRVHDIKVDRMHTIRCMPVVGLIGH